MGIYLLLIAAVMIWLDRKLGIACCLIALITYGIYYWQSKKHFGGITGDTAGYFVTFCEGCVVVAAAIAEHMMLTV